MAAMPDAARIWTVPAKEKYEAATLDVLSMALDDMIAADDGLGELQMHTIRNGDLKTYPENGDTLLIHYEGRLADDIEAPPFASTYSPKDPAFVVLGDGSVIRGRCQRVAPGPPHWLLPTPPTIPYTQALRKRSAR